MFDLALGSDIRPLQQTAAYARALQSMGVHIDKRAFAGGEMYIQVQWWPVLGWTGLLSRGPVWHGVPDTGVLSTQLEGLQHTIVVNDDGENGETLRGMGAIPVMTPSSLAVLELRPNHDDRRAVMRQKWRNRLSKAMRAKLRVRHVPFPADPDHWILQSEHKQRKRRKYRGLPGVLAAHYAHENPGDAHLFWIEKDGAAIAGMVFLRHHASATYFLGHTTPEGRACNAHTLILAQANDWFANNGVCTVDLGSVDTVNAPGLARFKLGCGARIQRLGGTWLYTPRLSKVVRLGARLNQSRTARQV